MGTKIVPISDLRRQASKIIKTVRERDDAVYITQHGRPAAVVLSFEVYEALLQELADLKADRVPIDYSAVKPQGALAALHEMAQDLGVEDLAEQHDHYLYGVEKE